MKLNFNKGLRCDGCGRGRAAMRRYGDGSTANLCRQCAAQRSKERESIAQEAYRVSRKLRDAHGRTCQGCGKECDHGELETHHKIPLALGGGNEPENLAFLCGDCHTEAHRAMGRGR